MAKSPLYCPPHPLILTALLKHGYDRHYVYFPHYFPEQENQIALAAHIFPFIKLTPVFSRLYRCA
jgi:hypothetical protein